MSRPNIYAYDDFRKLLADWMEYWISKEQSSQRALARTAGISNPGYLNDVIQGRRTLSRSATDKFAQAFGLDSKECEYLRLIIEYGQSKSPSEKDEIMKLILARRSRSSFARVHSAQVKYYQESRYPLVRCALEAQPICEGDWEKLGKSMDPPLAPAIVRKTIEELCEWGMLAKDKEGKYRPTARFVEPAPTLGAQVRRLNQQWLKDAAEGIERWPKDQRNISTILMAVSPEAEQLIAQKTEAFRREIFAILEEDQNPSRMCQLSLAYFPRQQKGVSP